MSFEATKWAWKMIREGEMPTAAQRLVLLNLADRAQDGTWHCWPSIRRIGKDTGLAPNTVRVAIHSLEKMGLLARDAGNTKRSNTYTLPLAPVPVTGTPPVPITGTPLCSGQAQPVPTTDTPRAWDRHRTSKESSKEPPRRTKDGKDEYVPGSGWVPVEEEEAS